MWLTLTLNFWYLKLKNGLIYFSEDGGWFFFDPMLSRHTRSSWADFNHSLVVRPQGCQGYQKIHKNILEIKLMRFCPKHSAKVEIKLKNLKNWLFFLSTVWLGLNRASILIPLLLITYLVNKQLRNHPEIARFRIYDFFSNLSTNRVWPNQAKSWK